MKHLFSLFTLSFIAFSFSSGVYAQSKITHPTFTVNSWDPRALQTWAWAPGYCLGYKTVSAQRVATGIQFSCLEKTTDPNYRPYNFVMDVLSTQSDLDANARNHCNYKFGGGSYSSSVYVRNLSTGFDNPRNDGLYVCR